MIPFEIKSILREAEFEQNGGIQINSVSWINPDTLRLTLYIDDRRNKIPWCGQLTASEFGGNASSYIGQTISISKQTIHCSGRLSWIKPHSISLTWTRLMQRFWASFTLLNRA